MNNLRYYIPAFIAMVLVQLYVPARMILDREKVMDEGKIYRFKAAPIDPSDPFRGKYITLNFEENSFETTNETTWESGETVYLTLRESETGFAKIASVSKEAPSGDPYFLKAEVNFASSQQPGELFITFPFDRFYMEETKAPEAEILYTESLPDTTRMTYALVSILEGDAVLKDMLIDEVSIRELVKAKQATESQ